MSIRHLRVRIKELASEAKHIRHEERQVSGMEKWRLQHHRKTIVRSAARRYLLAYGYMRSTPYRVIEQKCDPDNVPSWKEVAKIVTKFGGDATNIDEWRKTPLTPVVDAPIVPLVDRVAAS